MADIKRMTFKHSKPGTRSKGFEITTIDKLLNNDKPSVLTKPCQVKFYNMIFIDEGRGSFEIDFREYRVGKGDIIFVSEEREHRFIDYEALGGIFIIFTEDFLYEILGSGTAEVLDLFKDTYLNPVIETLSDKNSFLERQLELLRDIYDEDNTDFDLQIFTLAFQTFLKMVGKKFSAEGGRENNRNKVFLEFSDLIEKNIRQIKTVQAYSDIMNISKKTINLATHRAVNMSAKQYIIYRLVQKLKISLCFEEKNIDEIAREFEFSEAYNLTKFFKRYTGVTPTSFKKLNT